MCEFRAVGYFNPTPACQRREGWDFSSGLDGINKENIGNSVLSSEVGWRRERENQGEGRGHEAAGSGQLCQSLASTALRTDGKVAEGLTRLP